MSLFSCAVLNSRMFNLLVLLVLLPNKSSLAWLAYENHIAVILVA